MKSHKKTKIFLFSDNNCYFCKTDKINDGVNDE